MNCEEQMKLLNSILFIGLVIVPTLIHCAFFHKEMRKEFNEFVIALNEFVNKIKTKWQR